MSETETPTIDETRAEAADVLGLPSDEERGPRRARTAADLKRRAVHDNVVLPSGAIVSIRLPNLPLLVKSGKLPNALVDAAIRSRNVEEVTREMIEEEWDYTEFIIPLILVEPEVEAADVQEMDPSDIQLLLSFVARITDTDAIGRQLGGLDTQESFREFRAEQSLRAALGGV